MTAAKSALPKIVSRDEWLNARKELLEREKELTRQRDRVNAARRRLPMVKVEKDYAFEGPDGKVKLIDLFDGSRQLIVYHFMFDPKWDEGCPNCTIWGTERSQGQLNQIRRGDANLVCISRAPYAKLADYAAKKDFKFPWYSSYGSDFNFDFNVSFDEKIAPVVYNYRSLQGHREEGTSYFFDSQKEGQPYELHGMSVFIRDENKNEENVYHTYSTYARGCEEVGGAHYFLDITPYGRQQAWEDSPEGWPQEPLEYGGRQSVNITNSGSDDKNNECHCD